MRVSVVIPLYNQAAYVRKAIESAIGQKGFKDYEVIVVNDGSTDGSKAVAQSYGSSIKILDQTNRGLAAARNAGMAAAAGEFFLPLDADDWIEPTYLAKTVPLMSDPSIGIVSTDMQRHGGLTDRVPPRGLTLELEMRGNELPCCSLIRRTAFEQAGGYNPAAPAWEDWSLWLSILKRGWKVAVVNEPLFHYLVKPVSMVTATHGREADLYRRLKQFHSDLRWPS